ACCMETADDIVVEIVHASPGRQALRRLKVPTGTTARAAVERSGLLQEFPEIDLDGDNKLGIFGRLCPADRVLEAGDRVEIYRPLLADPKEVRRRLAAEGRSMGRNRREEPAGD